MTQHLMDRPSLWVERLGRFGYASKGIVYAIVGLLAAQVAFGTGGKTTDTKGALQTLVEQPFGQILLALVAIGLIGYVLWRFVEAIKDPEHKGNDAKGLAQRISYAINGFIYAGLAYSAVQILLGSSNSGNSNSTQDWTARLLSQPFGQWLVGTGGAFVIGLGFYQFYKAYSTKFQREFNLSQLSHQERKWMIGICRFGLVARGIVFCIIGWFFIQAATQSNAQAAGGLDEALQTLAQQPYGPWLLGFVALGLIAYGIYMAIKARYSQLVVN
ncbi:MULTISPECIES: DUF1206 domain-containing protein [unclassified Tolypothrix]|uniref:DUF1206 domain-containing protein n=1 Tax=unclassified Tolypothrix TaxID=2649714 RepID=UPI0005F8540A|nr:MULTISPECIES: DUF1206 domain-containing protein [unclassified Tolypothrix]MBE9083437.1 DUF1206 domain-containing protein [Tolypothrix sp. LEGE 11397]UYD25581.1 DUF1206 domain-containing protein [Tolypothrix sp. PCC 7712]UYD37903.1 DUF1206 domain-containing protein [Tolypothrix sp. PCC 7601]BAY91551.1 hypothetical protein NIES3275_35750 [Microchaete diplosiphon NIES-3275]